MKPTGYGKFFSEVRKARKNPPSGKNVPTMKRRRSQPMPVVPIFILLALVAGGLWVMWNSDQAERWFHKLELRALASAEAEEKGTEKSTEKNKEDTAKKEETKGSKEEKSSSAEGPGSKTKSEDMKTWTPEQLALFSKLEERTQGLNRREEELKKLEEELQQQKLALEKRLKELETIRGKISDRLDEKVKIDQEKVDKLVEVYSNMKPQNAAKVIEEINEDLAIEVLAKMKKKNAAELLNLLKPEKAQRLSEKFAGYKRD